MSCSVFVFIGYLVVGCCLISLVQGVISSTTASKSDQEKKTWGIVSLAASVILCLVTLALGFRAAKRC